MDPSTCNLEHFILINNLIALFCPTVRDLRSQNRKITVIICIVLVFVALFVAVKLDNTMPIFQPYKKCFKMFQ